jgi:hypothetical protein
VSRLNYVELDEGKDENFNLGLENLGGKMLSDSSEDMTLKENGAPGGSMTMQTAGDSADHLFPIQRVNTSNSMIFSNSDCKNNSGILLHERTSSLLNWPSCTDHLQFQSGVTSVTGDRFFPVRPCDESPIEGANLFEHEQN